MNGRQKAPPRGATRDLVGPVDFEPGQILRPGQILPDGATEGDCLRFRSGFWQVESFEEVANTTPSFTTDGAGADPNVGASGTLIGRYTKIGRLVTFYFHITFSGAGLSAGSGIYVVGLPFDVASGVAMFGVGRIFDASTSAWLDIDLVAGTSVSSLAMQRRATGASPDSFVAHNVPISFASGDDIQGTVTYQIDE